MKNSTEVPDRNQPRYRRGPVVSGFFYPSSPQELALRISALLSAADLPVNRCSAIISPHGSLDYSGAIAAKAWKAAAGRDVGTIVILSPSHRSFEQGIFMPEAHYFSVPTRTFKVDRLAVKELLHCSTSLSLSDIPHFEEHSIEMQLIYAAQCFPEALILPIIVSGADDQALDGLFSNLHFILGKRLESTLFVLTSNLAVDEDADTCLRRSADFLESIEKEAPTRIHRFCDSAPSFCGARIIAGYMRSAFSEGTRPHLFGLGSSAALAEAGEPIVGYAALGFSR
ncbi:MAG TPA: AmmeMemoRadiSam system protein B [Rectinemataceae bacterium]|nr:AmmeMemoRadiSam system protein B [Rectinemataceae bacterium]